MSEGFRTFDHTGDLGLEVWAATPSRLFELAAVALMAQIAEVPPGEAQDDSRAQLALEAEDAQDLLVHWLNSVLLEAELAHAIWTGATMASRSPLGLVARVSGPRLDPSRHVTLREVKAVSHHGLELSLAAPDCRCRLVLDL